MATADGPARRARREASVFEHMQSENVQEWERTMKTFSHARYELPDGRVIDGHDAQTKRGIGPFCGVVSSPRSNISSST